MLEQPCAGCGQLLEVNDDACPACGAPRRRTRRGGWNQTGWLVIMGFISGGMCVGMVVALTTAFATRQFTPEALGLDVSYGLVGGIVASVFYYRRKRG